MKLLSRILVRLEKMHLIKIHKLEGQQWMRPTATNQTFSTSVPKYGANDPEPEP